MSSPIWTPAALSSEAVTAGRQVLASGRGAAPGLDAEAGRHAGRAGAARRPDRGDQARNSRRMPASRLSAGDAVPLRLGLSARLALSPRRPDEGRLLRGGKRRDGSRRNGVLPAAVLRRSPDDALAEGRRRIHRLLGGHPHRQGDRPDQAAACRATARAGPHPSTTRPARSWPTPRAKPGCTRSATSRCATRRSAPMSRCCPAGPSPSRSPWTARPGASGFPLPACRRSASSRASASASTGRPSPAIRASPTLRWEQKA